MLILQTVGKEIKFYRVPYNLLREDLTLKRKYVPGASLNIGIEMGADGTGGQQSLVQYTCAKVLKNDLCWFTIYKESCVVFTFLPHHPHKHMSSNRAFNTALATGSLSVCWLSLLFTSHMQPKFNFHYP